MNIRLLFGLGCCLLVIAGCRSPGHPCPADHSAGRRDRCDSAQPAPPLAIQADRSNCPPGKLPTSIVPPLSELPSDAQLQYAKTIPPQKVIIEVVQQASAPNHSDRKSAETPAPAPAAPPLPALTMPAAAPPFASGAVQPVMFTTQAPAVLPTIGLAIDLGAVLEWFRSPFQWLRIVAMPQALPTPAVVPAQALIPVQAMPAVVPTVGAITAPPASQAALRASDVDELTRTINELRQAIDTMKKAKGADR